MAPGFRGTEPEPAPAAIGTSREGVGQGAVLPQTIPGAPSTTQAHGFDSKGPELLLQKPPSRWRLPWLLCQPSDPNKDPGFPTQVGPGR